MNEERLAYIKKYFAEQGQVKVEVPPFISETTRGTILYRFNGDRFGYKFKDGLALVDRRDLHHFEGQHYIIHDGREQK